MTTMTTTMMKMMMTTMTTVNNKTHYVVTKLRTMIPARSTFVEATTLLIWWAMTITCLGALFLSIATRTLYKCVIYTTAFLLEKTSKWNYGNSRVRVIYDRNNEDTYLIRHYLLIKDRGNFPFNVFLHKFMKGDEEDIHDHPWGFFHIVLSGGYYEHVTVNPDGCSLDQGLKKVWRGAGHWNFASSFYKHRIELGESKPWTLFVPFRRCREWSFWVKNETDDNEEWIEIGHEKYLKNRMSIKND